MRSKVARFYGWGDDEISGMSEIKVRKYWQAITAIEARECLMLLAVNDYPHLKKHDRSKVYRRFYRLAYPEQESANTMSMEDFAKRIAGAVKNG